jgi:hypothetical protein
MQKLFIMVNYFMAKLVCLSEFYVDFSYNGLLDLAGFFVRPSILSYSDKRA